MLQSQLGELKMMPGKPMMESFEMNINEVHYLHSYKCILYIRNGLCTKCESKSTEIVLNLHMDTIDD